MSTSIDTLIANARSYANEAVAGAISWVTKLAELEDLVASLVFIDGTPTWAYQEIGDDARSGYRDIKNQKPTRPFGLGDFDLGQPPDFDGLDLTLLKRQIGDLITLVSTIPDRFAQAIALYDAVNNLIIYDLANGGYGIDSRDEEALWERTRDRESLAANINLTEIRKQYAIYGQQVPPGAMLGAIQDAINKAQDQMSTVNRDISIKRADLYRVTREFTINKSIELATAQLGLTKVKVEIMRDAVLTTLESAKIELEEYKGSLSKYGYEFTKVIEEQKIRSEVYRTDITGWATQMDTLGKSYALLQQGNTDQLSADRVAASESIQRARAQIETFNTITNVKVNAMTSIAQVLAQKVSGALSSLNTLVSQITEMTED